MKKKLSIIALASMSLFSLAGVVLGTVSWFVANNQTPKELNIKGQSAGAYFAYGDGLPYEEDGEGKIIHRPYGISVPRHLYNLSWLQYMGQFDDGQYYFEIADNVSDEGLDMDGYILPPIGTEEKPFVGNFNGKGKIIKNLIVTNDEDELFSSQKHPDQTQVTYEAPEIVGLFGVVGNYNNAYEGTYDSSTNSIFDLGIYGITVKSSTNNTLIGIAAGYVDGLLSNVAVNESSVYTSVSASAITSITDCVSNYSLVGYCTDECLGEMKLRSDDADIPTLNNPNTESGGDNWGGSINMQEMYTYLSGVRSKSTRYSFVTEETIAIDTNGTRTVTSTETTYNGRYDSGFGYTSYTGYKAVVDDEEYASFSIAASYSNANFNTLAREQYVCLYGPVTNKRGTTAGNYGTTNANKTVTTKTYTQHTGQYVITDNKGNFLRVTGTNTKTNVTTLQSGCYFTLNSDGNLYTTYNNTTYYLYYYNATSFRAANNPSNANLNSAAYKWTYDETNHRLSVNDGDYYMYLNNTTWSLVSDTTTSQAYSFTYNGNYLNASGTNLVLGGGNNTDWFVNGNNVYTIINGTNYYICYSGTDVVLSENGNRLTFGSNKFYYTRSSGGYYSTTYYYPVEVNGTTLSVNSSSTATSTRNMGGATFTRDNKATEYTYEFYHTYYTNDYVIASTSTSTTEAVYDTYATYFPLTRDKDDDGNYTTAGNAGKPDEKNTGYLVSGANMTTPTNQAPFGDVRVSYFTMDNLSAALNQESYDDNKLEVVTRTCVRNDNGSYTDSDWTRISDEKNANNTSINTTLSNKFADKKNYKTELRLSKYKNSRSQLGSSLSSSNNRIYGLHFMDAAISKSRLVTAPKAIVLDGKTLDGEGKAIGSVYENYQLPQDSIDFNLKDQGFINFFAGSYFTDNDAFFSLHKISRDDSTHNITNIQEIKKIYAPASGTPSNENPYIYSFDGNKPANSGDLVFDTAWIKTPSIVMNALYYFEIPVNAGEYALGSVSGGIGAYLMYLDIGAGINNYHDVITTEHVETIAKGTSFPKGIEFHSIVAGTPWSDLEGGETACVKVATGTNAQQTLTFTYGNSVLTVSTAENDPPITAEYEAIGVGIKKKIGDASATDLTFSPPTLYTMERDAITSENYNVFTSIVTKTIEETYTITGAKNGVKIQLSLPQKTTGFTSGNTVFTVVSGPATVDQNGLITITGTGAVEVSMTYSETKADVEEWNTSLVIDDVTEGTIFEYHLRDYNMPNLVTRYVYDGATKTYTIYMTATVSGEILIDTLPPEGYTVVVIINNGTPITLTSASTATTSITITV